ncbi:hypothetical protein ACFL27_08305 [candidate division CSSED10-310 bacterium]|uniref:Uncharacterized protein n=1 Tax=candidate division CSSED10-310 bacterium TaxID=2855610 RepID=A0ABV6YVF1_UNCC1
MNKTKKVLKCIGIDVDSIQGKQNVAEAIAEARKEYILEGLYNLIGLCKPGTDIEIAVKLEHIDPLTLNFKLGTENSLN